MTRVVLFSGVGLAGFIQPAASQDSTSCSFDTAAHTVTESVILGIGPLSPAGKPLAGRDDYALAAQAVQAQFRRPPQVRLPFWARTVLRDPVTGVPTGPRVDGYVRFRLDRVGRLVDQDVSVDLPSPDLAQSIAEAVKRADSANGFSPPSGAVLHDHGTIRLRVQGIPIQLSIGLPDTSGANLPLMRLLVPAVVVDSQPAVISFPSLQYPAALRAAGLGDRVLLRFLVLSNGQVDPASLDLLKAEYRETALEAIRYVQTAKFRPARIDTCAVPFVAKLPVTFKIRRN